MLRPVHHNRGKNTHFFGPGHEPERISVQKTTNSEPKEGRRVQDGTISSRSVPTSYNERKTVNPSGTTETSTLGSFPDMKKRRDLSENVPGSLKLKKRKPTYMGRQRKINQFYKLGF